MNFPKRMLVLLCAIVLLMLPALAAGEAPVSEDGAPATDAGNTDELPEDKDSRALSTYLLLFTVIGGVVVSALIYRKKDEGKYL